MSRRAETLVWERSRAKGSNLLVLLSVADYALRDGRNAWPGVQLLARMARLTERAVRLVLHKLEADGEIVIHLNTDGRPVDIDGRRVQPLWFIDVRCVCDWEAYEHEEQPEKISSGAFPEGRPPNRKRFPVAVESKPEQIDGKPEKISGQPEKISGAYKEEILELEILEQGSVQAGAPPRASAPPPKKETPDPPAVNIGLITKFAHEAMDLLGLEDPDLPEAVKTLCATRIPGGYDSAVVRKAIESASWQRRHPRAGRG